MTYDDLLTLSTHLKLMRSSPISNYALPGLSSSLLEHGKARLFQSDRDTEDHITPHSHRFDFVCLVLEGSVINQVYRASGTKFGGNMYGRTRMRAVDGGFGKYERVVTQPSWGYNRTDTEYLAGSIYSMARDQVHSIKFSKGATVLFLEGPPMIDTFDILEPATGSTVIPTFTTQPWMFQRKAV